MCCTVADHAYTHLKGPIAWMAPETFDEGEKGHVVSAASDVYMLGSCFVEVATGCERQPFDWLSPQGVLRLRYSDSTRSVSCIQVSGVDWNEWAWRRLWRRLRCHIRTWLICCLPPGAQASRDAKPEAKPYQWRVVASDAVVSQLMGAVEGCLVGDAAARWTVSQVIDTLAALRRDISAGVAGSTTGSSGGSAVSTPSATAVVATGAVVPPPPPAPVPLSSAGGGSATYDVLALLEALASVGVDDAVVATVADAIGHLAVSSLGILNTCGVAGAKSLAVRRQLAHCEDHELVRS